MAKFNSKTFNPNAFGKYVDTIPKKKKNELIKSKALQPNSQIKTAFSGQTGVVYATIPMYGRIGGTPINYDGVNDITATGTTTYERGVVVIGRAKAWTEKDFAEDVTGGAGFMSHVGQQVAEYWDDIDQETLLSILKGIYRMTGADNLKFVNGHTYDITGATVNTVAAGTLNTAIQKACGDKKAKFGLCIMHSVVATNLENLQLLSYMTYNDAQGIQRQLSLATWNGRVVLIDDGMPFGSVQTAAGTQGVYKITVTTKAVAGDKIQIDDEVYECVASNPGAKQWAAGANVTADASALKTLLETQYGGKFTVTSSSGVITLTQVVNGVGGVPVVAVTQTTNGTLVAAASTDTAGVEPTYADTYTTYVFGEGAFDYVDIGAEVPYEMQRDPKTNGGLDTLYSRQRKVFAPYGISFTKSSMASNSPTDAELEDGANWTLVNDGSGEYIDHKSIAIARIISRG